MTARIIYFDTLRVILGSKFVGNYRLSAERTVNLNFKEIERKSVCFHIDSVICQVLRFDSVFMADDLT